MKILVLSDSHSSLRHMRLCIESIRPDAVIHLGDHYEDAQALAEEYSHIPFHPVAGNCDRYRCPVSAREMLCYKVGGVMLFMTHGHNHGVKQGLYSLVADARAANAQAVLFGHTHNALCEQRDGLWILNPGACNHGGGTVGLIEAENGNILNCRILREEEWEAML